MKGVNMHERDFCFNHCEECGKKVTMDSFDDRLSMLEYSKTGLCPECMMEGICKQLLIL